MYYDVLLLVAYLLWPVACATGACAGALTPQCIVSCILLPVAYCLLPVAYRLLSIAYCLLPRLRYLGRQQLAILDFTGI